ncbi:unnamed protein product [Vitrella brassicaformis CCMP3155]|uniref:FHA domain-containing protein n=2 Tax=Vitrella brassicaformis TaxID=1169539 RepID=A0A0G4GC88_VITBC|nr:unnamed protein product [Vitrella brassicaformis CCMP3155]|eukprot:CEM26461.1 unnamed protein product [Vitrella brassicaformis CCMP3155]
MPVLGFLRTSTTLYELEETKTTIGRDESCDIVLTSRGVSRFHAVLEFGKLGGEKATLTDLGSCNGTFVNNVRLPAQQAYPLEHADVIFFSAYEKVSYRFEVPGRDISPMQESLPPAKNPLLATALHLPAAGLPSSRDRSGRQIARDIMPTPPRSRSGSPPSRRKVSPGASRYTSPALYPRDPVQHRSTSVPPKRKRSPRVEALPEDAHPSGEANSQPPSPRSPLPPAVSVADFSKRRQRHNEGQKKADEAPQADAISDKVRRLMLEQLLRKSGLTLWECRDTLAQIASTFPNDDQRPNVKEGILAKFGTKSELMGALGDILAGPPFQPAEDGREPPGMKEWHKWLDGLKDFSTKLTRLALQSPKVMVKAPAELPLGVPPTIHEPGDDQDQQKTEREEPEDSEAKLWEARFRALEAVAANVQGQLEREKETNRGLRQRIDSFLVDRRPDDDSGTKDTGDSATSRRFEALHTQIRELRSQLLSYEELIDSSRRPLPPSDEKATDESPKEGGDAAAVVPSDGQNGRDSLKDMKRLVADLHSKKRQYDEQKRREDTVSREWTLLEDERNRLREEIAHLAKAKEDMRVHHDSTLQAAHEQLQILQQQLVDAAKSGPLPGSEGALEKLSDEIKRVTDERRTLEKAAEDGRAKVDELQRNSSREEQRRKLAEKMYEESRQLRNRLNEYERTGGVQRVEQYQRALWELQEEVGLLERHVGEQTAHIHRLTQNGLSGLDKDSAFGYLAERLQSREHRLQGSEAAAEEWQRKWKDAEAEAGRCNREKLVMDTKLRACADREEKLLSLLQQHEQRLEQEKEKTKNALVAVEAAEKAKEAASAWFAPLQTPPANDKVTAMSTPFHRPHSPARDGDVPLSFRGPQPDMQSVLPPPHEGDGVSPQADAPRRPMQRNGQLPPIVPPRQPRQREAVEPVYDGRNPSDFWAPSFRSTPTPPPPRLPFWQLLSSPFDAYLSRQQQQQHSLHMNVGLFGDRAIDLGVSDTVVPMRQPIAVVQAADALAPIDMPSPTGRFADEANEDKGGVRAKKDVSDLFRDDIDGSVGTSSDQ